MTLELRYDFKMATVYDLPPWIFGFFQNRQKPLQLPQSSKKQWKNTQNEDKSLHL